MSGETVVVVGAGLAGLSAACRLAGDGHRVIVCERDAEPGGRAGRLRQDGFAFDTGPTVLTMPELIDDAFRAVGTTLADELELHQLDPAYRAWFADGSSLDVRAGHEPMRAEIAEHCGPDDAAAFDEFVVWLRRLYEVELPHFIDRNYDTPLGLLRRPRAAAALLRAGGFGRLGPAIRKRFRDPRLHRIFSFQAMYAGLAPDQALAIYAVITYMDSIAGVWAPAGGIHAVPRALAAAAERAGVEFRYRTAVDRVLTRGDGAVAGVSLCDGESDGDTGGGESIAASAVVSTLDPPYAWRTILAGMPKPRRWGRAAYSPSAVVWHVGARGAPPGAARHHNLHFGAEWESAFTALLEGGSLMPDPSRLVCVPSLDDPGAAPDGATALYVLEPVPNLVAGTVDWTTEAPRMRERLHAFLDRHGYPTEVITEKLITPLDWRDQGMAAGTPFAAAHTFAQTGPFRIPNRVRGVPGLVLAGSGTVPGVGVPMVLISGKLAAARVGEYLR